MGIVQTLLIELEMLGRCLLFLCLFLLSGVRFNFFIEWHFTDRVASFLLLICLIFRCGLRHSLHLIDEKFAWVCGPSLTAALLSRTRKTLHQSVHS